MTATGRRVRLAATVAVFGLLLAGSFAGEDHHFPFGPFRMYATSGKANSSVQTPALVGVVGGEQFRIDPESLGVRRAELEGQINRFRKPELLASLARAYQRRGVPLDELRLVKRIRRIEDGERVGPTTSKVIAVWRAS